METDTLRGNKPAGRPRIAAVISIIDDEELSLYDRFFRVCKQLRYSDRNALAHGLGLTVRTVRNWCYGLNFPKEKSIAKAVIDWYEQGKPVKKVLQCERTQRLL